MANSGAVVPVVHIFLHFFTFFFIKLFTFDFLCILLSCCNFFFLHSLFSSLSILGCSRWVSQWVSECRMWRVAVWAVLLLGWACLPTCSHSRSALPFHSPLFSSLTKKSRSHSRTRISSSRVKQRVSDDVDEELYSRQLLVLGRDSQLRLKDSHVALTGTG